MVLVLDGFLCEFSQRRCSRDRESLMNISCRVRRLLTTFAEIHLSHPTALLRAAKMFHDLNVPWSPNDRELQRTIAFLDECEL